MSAPLNPTKLIGATLDDRYEILERLHVGGMGTVYLATDQRLERKVVVKIPHATLLAEKGFTDRFQREIKSLMKLEHPHIVKVLDAGKLDLLPFAVFQHLGGGSLAQAIADAGGRQSVSEVVAWLRHVAPALEFMHKKKTLHRDVKPSNLLFDEDGNLIIADFGVVKAYDRTDGDLELTMKGQVPGSPEFMAPESLTTADLTPAYDQFALGVTVYLALSGRLPAEYKNPLEALIRKQPPTPLSETAPHVPAALADAVMRTLADKPEDRYASCGAFLAAFEAGVASASAGAAAGSETGDTAAALDAAVNEGETLSARPIVDVGDLEFATIPQGTPVPRTPKTSGASDASGQPLPMPRLSPSAVPGGGATVALPSDLRRKSKTNKGLLAAVIVMIAVLGFVIAAKLSKKTASVAKPIAVFVTEPAEGTVTRERVIGVRGRVDNPKATVYVDGKRVSLAADGGFYVQVELRGQGSQMIGVEASLKGAKTVSAQRTVVLDRTKPELTLTAPAANHRTRESSVTVRGKANEKGVTVAVNGATVAVDESGTFSIDVPLDQEGEIVVAVLARDAAGNEEQQTVKLFRDATPPTLTVSFPPAGGAPFVTSDGTVEVRGIVGEADAKVLVAGKPVALDDKGAFSVVVELPEAGEQTVAVSAADALGNTATSSVRVNQDTMLVMHEPVDGLATREAKVTVRGKVYGSQTVLTVAGHVVQPEADGSFTVVYELPAEGQHTLDVSAERGGEPGIKVSLRVFYDATAPTISVTSPKPDIKFFGNKVRVQGVVKDNFKCEVLVNGRPAEIGADGTWNCVVKLPVGTERIVAEAVDRAGNRSEKIERKLIVPEPAFAGLTRRGRNQQGLWEFALEKDKTVVLILIPERLYRRGAAENDTAAAPDESPARYLRVGPYLIGKTPVTRAQYTRFCEATKRAIPQGGPAEHPVVNVSHVDATAYAEWAGLRLPSEAEWELAARGGAGGRFPWGDNWKPPLANAGGRRGGTTAVRSLGTENGFGLWDVAGNVLEWCADWYHAEYYAAAPNIEPIGPAQGTTRVLRGGSWRREFLTCRLSARFHDAPDKAEDEYGIRIARGPKRK